MSTPGSGEQTPTTNEEWEKHYKTLEEKYTKLEGEFSTYRTDQKTVRDSVEKKGFKEGVEKVESWLSDKFGVESNLKGDDLKQAVAEKYDSKGCLLYTSPSPRDATLSRMPSSA